LASALLTYLEEAPANGGGPGPQKQQADEGAVIQDGLNTKGPCGPAKVVLESVKINSEKVVEVKMATGLHATAAPPWIADPGPALNSCCTFFPISTIYIHRKYREFVLSAHTPIYVHIFNCQLGH